MVLLAGTASWVAVGQSSGSVIKSISLSSEPLYAPARGDKPTLTLALSVEYPTMGAQYRDNFSYSNSNEYLGYWDSGSCYSYRTGGGTADDPSRFVRIGPAESVSPAQRTCADAFSGNFLNWAATSSMDIIRLALTGGDRILDTPTQTVLQRAVLPDGTANYQIDFSRDNAFFPTKQLNFDGGTSTKPYFGAIPQSMVTWLSCRGNPCTKSNMRIKQWRDQMLFGPDWFQDHHDWYFNLTNGEAGFHARVEVCGKDASGSLADNRPWSLCKKQSNGNYKPIGTIQRYSDQVRVAVFGYLMDGWDRYGGVLRAPMKFVGNKTFDNVGSENTPAGGNASAEWDAETGVFVRNPLGDTLFGISGVVNYINQFGRDGVYKDHDPIGELHMEALRYLQGKSPSPSAVSGLDNQASNPRYSGFPAYAQWTDPYQGRDPLSDFTCHKANVLAVGDTVTWDHGVIPSPDVSTDTPDIDAWMNVVRRFETNQGGSYMDADGVPRTISGHPGAANGNFPALYGANHFQIFGSAYWARTHDIRDLAWTTTSNRQKRWKGLRVKTFTFDVNGEGLSDGNYASGSNNPLFMAAKYGGFETDPANADSGPFNVWGNPFLQSGSGNSNDAGSVTSAMGPRADYIWASRDSGREGLPNTYFRAGVSPLTTFSAFDTIFNRAITSASSIAGGAIQSKNLTKAGNTIYRGNFDISDWRGDLLAYAVTTNSDSTVTVSSDAKWSAAAQLNAMSNPVQDRKIYTGNPGGNASPVAVPFLWSSIGDSLKTALSKASTDAVPDALGSARLNFIRGDSSNYGTFRKRYQLMGDVINSGVVYSGAPDPTTSTSASYQTFYNTNANRTPLVAVGANDGMLHGFNATNGKELFAYIPSWVATNLSALTGLDYLNNHRSYVDGTPSLGEAEVSGQWETVLVSGTGAGGPGVFALKVTDPTQFGASSVLWEFTNNDDGDMGYVVGKPQVLKMRTSAPDAATATYQWFAVVGSGVNNYAGKDPSDPTRGQQALFLLDLSKPAGTPWRERSNYFKIVFPINATLNSTLAPGLINFTAVLDSAKAVSKMYMGDLQGNLWKLNFSASGSDTWTLANLSSFKYDSRAIPMYIAKDSSGNLQPITVAPTIGAADAANASKILFGTGKYLESADVFSTSVQSLYMVYDSGETNPDGTGKMDGGSTASAISNRNYLKAGTADSAAGTLTVPEYTLGLATSPSGSVKSGWVIDFPKTGERQIGNANLVGTKLVTSSLIPTTNASTSACGTVSAGGVAYSLDYTTGSGVSEVSKVGILGAPLVLENAAATTYSAPDGTGRKTKITFTQIIQQGSAGLSTGQAGGYSNDPNCPDKTPAGVICTPSIAGRLSWRQVGNYQFLKAGAS
jgi:type IV pilus assembly protein PilY1